MGNKQDDFINEFVELANEQICIGCKDKTEDCCCEKYIKQANENIRLYAIKTGQITIETLLKM